MRSRSRAAQSVVRARARSSCGPRSFWKDGYSYHTPEEPRRRTAPAPASPCVRRSFRAHQSPGTQRCRHDREITLRGACCRSVDSRLARCPTWWDQDRGDSGGERQGPCRYSGERDRGWTFVRCAGSIKCSISRLRVSQKRRQLDRGNLPPTSLNASKGARASRVVKTRRAVMLAISAENAKSLHFRLRGLIVTGIKTVTLRASHRAAVSVGDRSVRAATRECPTIKSMSDRMVAMGVIAT